MTNRDDVINQLEGALQGQNARLNQSLTNPSEHNRNTDSDFDIENPNKYEQSKRTNTSFDKAAESTIENLAPTDEARSAYIGKMLEKENFHK